MFGSIGNLPKYGTPNNLAIFSGVFVSLIIKLSDGFSVLSFGRFIGGVKSGASRNKFNTSGQRDLILRKLKDKKKLKKLKFVK